MKAGWKFEDKPNTVAFTTSFVLDRAPILRVYHDFDGDWQFHGRPNDPVTTDCAHVVSLESLISQDPTLAGLHDLPNGWQATRKSAAVPWTRAKNHPFPTYEEDGYYLEDAVWMAQHRNDVNPPSEEVRNDLPVGAYVKLLFRFAAEMSERQDGQTERMWVLITEIAEGESYVGTLENDPVHDQILSCGDTIQFHPLHVMQILDETSD